MSQDQSETKPHETLVYLQGITPLQDDLSGQVLPRGSSCLSGTQNNLRYSGIQLISIPFSSSQSRFAQRQRQVSGLATVSAVRDWSQIKVG